MKAPLALSHVLAPHIGFLVSCVWLMVYGPFASFIVYNSQFMVHGLLFIVQYSWFRIYTLRCVVHGLRFMSHILWFCVCDLLFNIHS